MKCRNLLTLTFLITFCSYSLCAKSNVIDLNEDNWRLMLTDEWMVEFFAPWCPACKGLTPVWNEFSKWSKDLGIKVGQVDVTTSPGLSGRFMVTALPTIFHVIDGEFRQYRGTRDHDAFMSFIEDKKWEKLEPVSAWKAPDSVQMSVISWFFKLSQILRGIHNQLMVDYGLPYWGSYLIFALATILLGAVLGLVLVCIIDFLYPPKMVHRAMYDVRRSDKDDKSTGTELADEDIKDDLVDEKDSDQEKNSAKDSDEENSSEKESENEKEDESHDNGEDDVNDAKKQTDDDDEDDNDEDNAGGDSENNKEDTTAVRKRKPRRAD